MMNSICTLVTGLILQRCALGLLLPLNDIFLADKQCPDVGYSLDPVAKSQSLLKPEDKQFLFGTFEDEAGHAEEGKSPSFRFAFFTFPTSEFQSSAALSNEMAKRGHDVTLAVGAQRAKNIPPAVKLWRVEGVEIWSEHFRNASLILQNMPVGAPKDFFPLIVRAAMDVKEKIGESMTAYFEEMEKQGTLPDACVFTWLLESLWHFCSSRNIPVVTQVPSVLTSPIFLTQPNRPVEDALALDYPGRRRATIYNRGVIDRLHGLVAWIFIKTVVPRIKIAKYDPLKPQEFSLRIVHSVPGFDFPCQHSPLIQYSGPLFPTGIFESRNISPDILSYLTESEALRLPVIYVCFGTLVRLTPERFRHVFDGLQRLAGQKWRVLWAYDVEQTELDGLVPGDSTHFKMVKWTSSPAVLAHSAVKLFFGHCGSNGAHEALYNRKPMLGIPFFGDQNAICDRLVASGAGTSLCHYTATADAIQETLGQMFEGYKKYSAAAFRLSLMMKAMGGLQKSGDLLEIVASLGHKQMMKLWKPPGEFDGHFKAFFLDFLAIVIVSSFLMGILLSKVVPLKRGPVRLLAVRVLRIVEAILLWLCGRSVNREMPHGVEVSNDKEMLCESYDGKLAKAVEAKLACSRHARVNSGIKKGNWLTF